MKCRQFVVEFYYKSLRRIGEPKLAMVETVRRFGYDRSTVYRYISSLKKLSHPATRNS